MSRRSQFDVDDHEFAGWEPENTLNEEDRELIRILKEQQGLGWQTQDAVDKRLKTVEGDLVPTCECGWRGRPVDWMSVSERTCYTGAHHISHKRSAQYERAQRKYAAQMAAAALKHAADAWEGDPEVAPWLRARADDVLELGQYDGEQWP